MNFNKFNKIYYEFYSNFSVTWSSADLMIKKHQCEKSCYITAQHFIIIIIIFYGFFDE